MVAATDDARWGGERAVRTFHALPPGDIIIKVRQYRRDTDLHMVRNMVRLSVKRCAGLKLDEASKIVAH